MADPDFPRQEIFETGLGFVIALVVPWEINFVHGSPIQLHVEPFSRIRTPFQI